VAVAAEGLQHCLGTIPRKVRVWGTLLLRRQVTKAVSVLRTEIGPSSEIIQEATTKDVGHKSVQEEERSSRKCRTERRDTNRSSVPNSI
jgi:hypothetical protein